jgi:hypothetical protein
MNQQELLPVLKAIHKPRRLIVGYASTDTPGVDVSYLRIRGNALIAHFLTNVRAKIF